jgi:hypothetical protein
MSIKLYARQLSILLLGIIVPLVVLSLAFKNISALSNSISYTSNPQSTVALLKEAKETIKEGNDYYLFSLIYTEHANQKTMINKQTMKVSIMQIGFAVISIGMMFIVLGINAGGAEGSIDLTGVKIDFKIASTGVVVFVVGTTMATLGGVLKNDYGTVPIPKYHFPNDTAALERLKGYLEDCKLQKDVKTEECFLAIFEQTQKEI